MKIREASDLQMRSLLVITGVVRSESQVDPAEMTLLTIGLVQSQEKVAQAEQSHHSKIQQS